jgi:hypothetical protein
MNRLFDIPARIEKKYAVHGDLAEHVLQRSRAFLNPDRGLGSQRLTTLYLDTPSLALYRAHLDRQPERFKLRIRGYGNVPPETVYAEIKQKAGDLVRKHRIEIPVANLQETLRDPSLQFAQMLSACDARPRVLVSGLRNALREMTTCGELAVTVDRHLVCQSTSRYDFTGTADAWGPLILPGTADAIVELKYMEEPPAWMASLITELAPYRVRFSKYSAAMEQQLVPEDLLYQEAVV